MSHTSKEPPSQYAAGDLPSNPPEGTVAYDKTNQKMVAFKNSSWGDFGGSGGVGSTTYVRDNVAGVIDQIQGDIPADWKQNDSSLRGLVIGASCTSIGNYAFQSCTGLTGSLVIPDSVTTIGVYAFWSCTGLTGSLVIPDSVTRIETGAFRLCTSITAVYTNTPAASWVGTVALLETNSLTTMYVNGVTALGYTSGAQTFQGKSLTIAEWTNYPNTP